MFDLKRLLQYEFFPAELPPCFSSDDLAANAQHAIQVASKLHRDYSIPLIYSGYKSETARRKFAVPNPYHYCKAVDCIVQQEPVLKPIFEKSPYSLTAPVDRVPKDRQPYAKRSSSIAETKREIELLYQDNRYEIPSLIIFTPILSLGRFTGFPLQRKRKTIGCCPEIRWISISAP